MKNLKKLRKSLGGFYADLMSVVAPAVCPVCGTVLLEGEECLCSGCLARLEYAGYMSVPANPMEQRLERLTGRQAPAAALLIYAHGEVSGRIVAAFKYSAERRLAIFSGELLGQALADSARFRGYDGLVPVPLHPSRLKRRGYNQAGELCRGIQSYYGLETEELLVRTVATREQASLGRTARLSNAADIFVPFPGASIRGRRLILVDDVFTTGVTVSSAARALYGAGAESVAVVCLCAG